jgi:TonB family protein
MRLMLLFAAVVFTLSPVAHAQKEAAADETTSEEQAGEDGAPAVTPPELVEYVQADYPPEAFAAGLEAEVVARLDVDETGLVTAVEILEPAGRGFDEAATDAMSRFVFVPATRGDVPIPSQVVYRYTFFIEDLEAPEEDQEPPVARLTGRVADMNELAVADASVVLVLIEGGDAAAEAAAGAGEELAALTVVTDSEGRFAFDDLVPGTYQVDVVAAGFKPLTQTEELVPGEERELIYRLEAESALYETVVRGRRPPREVTRREITRREITRIPGTGGDALRSVQNLPGMARAPGLSGDLIVRGSSPADSRYFFDQLPVPMLYHFGGLTSVINSDLLERIDFYPGNYSVRYGGATGGIVDVYPRAPATDRLHAYVDADIWDVSALVETPLGDKWSIAASGRRSYIDLILNAVLPSDGGFEFTVAPRYYDYQLIADYHPDAADNLRLFLFGSSDKMVFVFGDDVADNPNFGGGVTFGLQFHQLQARWDHRFTSAVSNQANVGVGIQVSEASFGEQISFDQKVVPVYLRDEFAWEPGTDFALRTGIDTEIVWAQWQIRAPAVFPTEGEEFDPVTANDEFVETDGQNTFFHPAWYGEFELLTIPDLRLIYGLRVDYWGPLAEVSLDPRFVARYQLFRGTTLKGGIGLFHQLPDPAQWDEDYGNPDLEPIGAVHYSVGVEQQIIDNVDVGLEGFYKDMYRLVVSSDQLVERDGELVPERFNNDGVGRVYGLELLLKHHPTDRFFGWISYTLMNSKRIDHPGEEERRFDFDQTHILTLVASAVLGRGWEAGVRFRLVSGNPVTPIVGSVYDADSDIYWPIYGQTNSERLPMFHQLDVRIDKNWQWKYLKLAVYIDVQNVYNQKNVEGYQYSYDFSEKVYFTGLPILPSLGLKLEY